MFMVQEITEDRHVDDSLFGEDPYLFPVVAWDQGRKIPIEGKNAVVFGEDETVVVGDTYKLISHREAFLRLQEAILANWPEEYWKAETGVTHGSARARVTWTFKDENFTYKIGGVRWLLQLRTFNSYDGFFPLGSELGLVNTEHGGRVAFINETNFLQRKRGEDPVLRWINDTVGMVRRHRDALEEPIQRAKTIPVANEELDEYLGRITDKWITVKGKKEVSLRFQAEERSSLWDLVEVLGWYTAKRMPGSGNQIVYRQELLYREIAKLADI